MASSRGTFVESETVQILREHVVALETENNQLREALRIAEAERSAFTRDWEEMTRRLSVLEALLDEQRRQRERLQRSAEDSVRRMEDTLRQQMMTQVSFDTQRLGSSVYGRQFGASSISPDRSLEREHKRRHSKSRTSAEISRLDSKLDQLRTTLESSRTALADIHSDMGQIRSPSVDELADRVAAQMREESERADRRAAEASRRMMSVQAARSAAEELRRAVTPQQRFFQDNDSDDSSIFESISPPDLPVPGLNHTLSVGRSAYMNSPSVNSNRSFMQSYSSSRRRSSYAPPPIDRVQSLVESIRRDIRR